MCTSFVPVTMLKSSPARWLEVPLPPEPKFMAPGGAREGDEFLQCLRLTEGA